MCSERLTNIQDLPHESQKYTVEVELATVMPTGLLSPDDKTVKRYDEHGGGDAGYENAQGTRLAVVGDDFIRRLEV